MERIAVADLGSNSWRLVVYSYEPGTHWWSLVDEIREAVRIGAGMGEEATLKPGPIERGLHTATVFAAFCRASGIERIEAVATSAIRDARNRDQLLDGIRRASGLAVRVLEPLEEARLGWLAIANSTTLETGFGIDLGGGSVQFMRAAERRLVEADSLPLGSVRVSERYLPGEKAPAKAIKALRKEVAKELREREWWSGGGRLVGIGGTIRNLAAAVEKRMDLPDVDAQGFLLERDALEELIELLAERPASRRGSLSGIKPDRGDVILGGALVVAEAMAVGDFDAIEVSEQGLREGIFLERLLADREPPLLDDVRRESVLNLAHRFNSDGAHVEHVARLSLELFDGLAAAGLHPFGEAERELLWAACLLHDIGTAIDYDDHHRHSQYLIEHAGLPGFSPRELVLVALIARYHRKGNPDAGELRSLEQPDDAARLALLCGVIRLAEQLERSRDQTVTGVRVAASNGRVRLVPSTGPGDASVGIWAAQRNADLLASAVGRELEIEPA